MKIAALTLAGMLAAVPAAFAADHDMGGSASEAAPFGSPIDDEHVWFHAMTNQLEGRFGSGNAFHWDTEAWAGTDTDRVWLKSEGQLNDKGEAEEGRYELLYDRPIASFFDMQTGLRTDADTGKGRTWAALGVEGLAPLFFHVGATGYVSSAGRLAARLEGSYDLLLTQQLILQPQLELNFYSKPDPGRSLGAGLADIDTGLRLRYELSRKFAPYIGLSYESKFGGTARLARLAGEPRSELHFSFGLRTWL